jgi:hypothetical protein
MEEHEDVENSQVIELSFEIKNEHKEVSLSKIKALVEEKGISLEEIQPSTEYQSEYFISEECEFIYYLAVLNGTAQTEALKIAPSFYNLTGQPR